jgi:hypothetical protein
VGINPRLCRPRCPRVSRVNCQRVFVEIVAKKKGCVLCELAIAILEEVSGDIEADLLAWDVVDLGSLEGIRRHNELTRLCGRRPPVPSIVIDDRIAFDNIPDFDSLASAVREAISRRETN